jgi:hypothetical protein
MKLKALTCEVLARPVYWFAAQSPHTVDVELYRYGLHSKPDALRDHLQAQIDAAGTGYDAIVIAYGLCGKATAGLVARQIPMIIPRAHDCITLFLGNRARYTEQFETKPGTYWYVQDYIERDDGKGASLSASADPGNLVTATYEQYVEKYGEDNAAYLMEVMGAWQQHYQRAAFIDLGIGDGSAVQEKAKAEATRRGWNFERLEGDTGLIRRLLWGVWDDTDFLRLEPGQEIRMSYDDRIVLAG